MSDELRSNGRNLVVILIPTKEQIEDDYWSIVAKHTGIEDRSKRFFLNEMMVTGLRARGATVLDMTERLRDLHARGKGPFYYRTDGHWNPDGHREAAQALAEVFSKESSD